jgi:hypothetical protein
MKEHVDTAVVTPSTNASTVDNNMVAMQSRLKNYIRKLFPRVYLAEESMWGSMLFEMRNNHKYLSVFFPHSSPAEVNKRLMMAFQFLTVQSFLLFAIAVTLDIDVSA